MIEPLKLVMGESTSAAAPAPADAGGAHMTTGPPSAPPQRASAPAAPPAGDESASAKRPAQDALPSPAASAPPPGRNAGNAVDGTVDDSNSPTPGVVVELTGAVRFNNVMPAGKECSKTNASTSAKNLKVAVKGTPPAASKPSA